MTNQEKEQIVQKLEAYIDRKGSLNKAAASVKGASPGTFSQMVNRNWELIKDEMWRNVGLQVGWTSKTWNVVETRAMERMTHLLTDAKENATVYAVCGDAGSGKTEAMKTFQANNKNAFLVRCNEFMNKKHFLQELLLQIGKKPAGYTVAELVQEIVRSVEVLDEAVIMLDEIDKVKDEILYFLITLYNMLEDNCGIVMVSTDYFEQRIRRGLRLNKKGYKEIYSRIGRKFVPLQKANNLDVSAISMANGLTNKADINKVINEAKVNEYDLRRVKKMVNKIKKQHLNTV